jgi:xylulokinase
MFPKVHASADVMGPLTREAATELGLPHGIPVSAGCADQPAQGVGNGLVDPPMGSVTIGTGGQVFVPLTKPLIEARGRRYESHDGKFSELYPRLKGEKAA